MHAPRPSDRGTPAHTGHVNPPVMALTSQGSGGIVRRSKQSVCESFISSLADRGDIDVSSPGFIDGIAQHFDKLPTRYALDVNTQSLDVLSHKRLLDEARSDPSTVSFAVRPVEVLHRHGRDGDDALPPPAFSEVGGAGCMRIHGRFACMHAWPPLSSCMQSTQSTGSASPVPIAGLAAAAHAAADQATAAQTGVWVIAQPPGAAAAPPACQPGVKSNAVCGCVDLSSSAW